MARFQQTLASQSSFARFGRKSERELFVDQMNQVVPWSELLALVEPVYPKAGNARQPVGLRIMLRTYPPRRTAVVRVFLSRHEASVLWFAGAAALCGRGSGRGRRAG